MHRNLLVISALALSLMPVSRCIMEPKLFCSYALNMLLSYFLNDTML